MEIMIKKATILALSVLFFYGCVGNSNKKSNEDTEIKSPIDDPVNITEEEANEIAIRQAAADGFDSPTLWAEGSTKISIVYSIKYEKDLKVYDVTMSTPGKLFGAFYYVSTENGEIIESTH